MHTHLDLHLQADDTPPDDGVSCHTSGNLGVSIAAGVTLYGPPAQLLEHATAFMQKVVDNLEHRPADETEQAARDAIATSRRHLQRVGAR